MTRHKRLPHFQILDWGLVYASICTNLDDETAERQLNWEIPTGIESRWKPSSDKTFASGQTNPSPCPSKPGFTHRLYSC